MPDLSRLLRPDGTIDEEEFKRLSEEAFAEADRLMRERDTDHAVFHGVERLRYGRVERRRGYLGQTVCLDCYYGKEWK